MTLRPLTLSIASLLAAATLALAACGGGEGGGGTGGDAASLLRDAMSKPIESGTLEADVRAELRGAGIPGGRVSVSLKGPFAANGDRLPKFDWEVSLGGGGLGLQGGLLSTGDNAFVEFRGSHFELGSELVAELNRKLAEKPGDVTAKSLGLAPERWFERPEVAEGGEVGGTETTKVSGDVDVLALLDDLQRAAERAKPEAERERLTPEQRRELEQAVEQARAEVYVADEDRTLRRLVVAFELVVPEDRRDEANGFEGGKVSLDVKITDVGRDVEVNAPENARPLGELLGEFGFGGAFLPRQ